MGSSSGTQSNGNDGLPTGRNAARARVDQISALRGRSDGVTLFHNTHSHNV